jgi:hypothetical protein
MVPRQSENRLPEAIMSLLVCLARLELVCTVAVAVTAAVAVAVARLAWSYRHPRRKR